MRLEFTLSLVLTREMASLFPWRFMVLGSWWSLGAAVLMGAATADLPGDRMLTAYWADEARQVNTQTFATIKTLADWTRERETYREQLKEMLGLSPLPARTDLKPTITG